MTTFAAEFLYRAFHRHSCSVTGTSGCHTLARMSSSRSTGNISSFVRYRIVFDSHCEFIYFIYSHICTYPSGSRKLKLCSTSAWVSASYSATLDFSPVKSVIFCSMGRHYTSSSTSIGKVLCYVSVLGYSSGRTKLSVGCRQAFPFLISTAGYKNRIQLDSGDMFCW